MTMPLQGITEEAEAKREVEREVQNYEDAIHKQVMAKRKLRRIINIIVDFISKTLTVGPGPMNKKLMMARPFLMLRFVMIFLIHLACKGCHCSTRGVYKRHESLR